MRHLKLVVFAVAVLFALSSACPKEGPRFTGKFKEVAQYGFPQITTAFLNAVAGKSNAQDIVVTAGTRVGVMLNRGDGSFREAALYDFSGASSDLNTYVADLDGNQKPDIVVMDSANNTIHILNVLVDSNTLALQATLHLSSEPRRVLDFKLLEEPAPTTLVSFSDVEESISIFIFDGEKYTEKTVMLKKAAKDMVVGKITSKNGDFVMLDEDRTTLNIYPFLGQEQVANPDENRSVDLNVPADILDDLFVGDLNNDGWSDLIAAGSSQGAPFDNRILILINDGTGGFPPMLRQEINYVGRGCCGIEMVDLDGDGFIDLGIAGDEDLIRFFFNQGNGHVAEVSTLPVGANSGDFSLGDLNADGRVDALVAYPNDGYLSILLAEPKQPPDIKFEEVARYGTPNFGAASLEKLWEDKATPDIVFEASNIVGLMKNRGDGSFEDASTFDLSAIQPGANAFSHTVVDLDGDGSKEVYVSDLTKPRIYVLTPHESGNLVEKERRFWNYQIDQLSTIRAKINGQEQEVVLVEGFGDVSGVRKGFVTFLFNDGGTLVRKTQTTVQLYDDLDFGHIASPDGDFVALYNNNVFSFPYLGVDKFSDPVKAKPILLNLPTTASLNFLFVNDFNNDGWTDVIALGSNDMQPTEDRIEILLNDGAGEFPAELRQEILTYGKGRGQIAMGDLDRDGWVDFVASNESTNSVSVFVNQGNGHFAETLVIPVGSKPESLSVGDLNADGKLDIVVANLGENSISILLAQ